MLVAVCSLWDDFLSASSQSPVKHTRFTPPAWHQTHLKISIFLRGNVTVGCYKKGGPLPTDNFPLSAETPKKTPQKTPVSRRLSRYTLQRMAQLVCVWQSGYSKAPPTTSTNCSQPIGCMTVSDATPNTTGQPISALMAIWLNVEDQKIEIIVLF